MSDYCCDEKMWDTQQASWLQTYRGGSSLIGQNPKATKWFRQFSPKISTPTDSFLLLNPRWMFSLLMALFWLPEASDNNDAEFNKKKNLSLIAKDELHWTYSSLTCSFSIRTTCYPRFTGFCHLFGTSQIKPVWQTKLHFSSSVNNFGQNDWISVKMQSDERFVEVLAWSGWESTKQNYSWCKCSLMGWAALWDITEPLSDMQTSVVVPSSKSSNILKRFNVKVLDLWFQQSNVFKTCICCLFVKTKFMIAY